MATKLPRSKQKVKQIQTQTSSSNPSKNMATTRSLRSDPSICYKLKVLIFDLLNVSKNRESMNRTLNTTDELYISSPYFTVEEAALIKSAAVDNDEELSEPALGFQDEEVQHMTLRATTPDEAIAKGCKPQTVEEAIQSRLSTFFSKRKASGDARPCGPHDMAPVYLSVFGISKHELDDPRFIGRLQRSGLST